MLSFAPAPDDEALQWPTRFRAQHGRVPRVLHVCNIANYAYVNAKLMRAAGVDAVVLDPDFYHVASTPEWLEADVEGDVGDPFHPRWWDVKLNGYRRPEWFLNGPTAFVFQELSARQRGRTLSRRVYAALSVLHRRGAATSKDTRPYLLKIMEGEDRASRLVKGMGRAALRAMTRDGWIKADPAAVQVHPHAARMDPAESQVIAGLLPPSVPEPTLRAAIGGFDAVIGYTLGARYAAGLGLKRFVSLELGTLRGLPFEDSDLGRQCAWLYRRSPEVMVTNLDCIEPALRLGIAPERITPIPHPFDVDLAVAFANNPPPSPFAEGVPYFFCPARQHWKNGNASWLKGNDVLIRGAALAASRAAEFRLVMVEWGVEIDLSRALIEELGLASRVTWIPIAPRKTLWPIIAGSVGVLDQFKAQAFGGVALETMALGKRLVSRIDGVELGPFFDTPPPILHAETPEQVADRMAAILSDPADVGGGGAAGQRWMMTQHGVDRQLSLQFAALDRLVSRYGPAE
jgi:glycosyltransferase involved in cell wall biosynthesis